jgi:hypothetical protein
MVIVLDCHIQSLTSFTLKLSNPIIWHIFKIVFFMKGIPLYDENIWKSFFKNWSQLSFDPYLGQINSLTYTLSLFFFFLWERGVISGLHTCKTGAPSYQPHFQSICSGDFGDGSLKNCFPRLALNCDPPNLSFQVPRITGVSHLHTADP